MIDAPKIEKVDKRKFNGGARKGAGIKKGQKHLATIEREITLKDIEKQIQKRASKLVDSTYIAAMGTYQICILSRSSTGKVEYLRVRDDEKMKELLDNGEHGVDYFVFAGEPPEWKAGESLLNRGFGKARESVVHSGTVGVMALIKQLNSSDGNIESSED